MESLSCINSECFALLKRHDLLRPLVSAEVIATVIANVEVSDDERTQALENFRKQQKIEEESAFLIWLQSNKISREQILLRLTSPLRLRKYCNQAFGGKVETHFLKRKNQLDQVIYSLIRVKDPFQARELYLQVAEGEADFGNVATKYSEGRERATRGIVGPVPLVKAHPKLADLLRSSKPGELREPIHVEGWHLIVRLESYQSAVLDAEMVSRMAQELFSEWVGEEVERRIDELSTALCEVVPMGSACSSS